MKSVHLLAFKRHLLATIGAALSIAAASAQNAAPTNASPLVERGINELVSEALDKNPELKFYEAEIAAAKAGLKTAGTLANPEMSASAGLKRVTGGGLAAEGVAWSVSVVQPFEWPGRMGLRKSIANRDLDLATLGLDRFKAALAGRVRALAYNLFAAREKSKAAGEVADRFKELLDVLVQRDPTGLTPLLETRVIEATELNSRRRATRSELATHAALLELNQLRGADAASRLLVNEPDIRFRELMPREALLALARTNNFELRLRAVELDQQGFRVDLTKNERYPAISVGPAFSEERAGGERERIIGLGISLPLPLWNRNTANIESARARKTQAEVSMALADREIQRQVIETAMSYELRLRDMEKWRPDSVRHFQQAAELADRHYRLGAVPVSVYVELQKQYLEAVEGLLDTRAEALEAAVKLEWLTGLSSSLAEVRRIKEDK